MKASIVPEPTIEIVDYKELYEKMLKAYEKKSDYKILFDRLLEEHKILFENYSKLQSLLRELEENRVRALYN